VRKTLDLLEAEDETLEAPPAGFGRAVGEMGMAAGPEGTPPPLQPGDLMGPEADQEIELGVGREQRGGNACAEGGAFLHIQPAVFVMEEVEAGADDVDKVRLHRQGRAEGPEDPKDDLPELHHGQEHKPGPQPG
jgi:hypothetical protein